MEEGGRACDNSSKSRGKGEESVDGCQFATVHEEAPRPTRPFGNCTKGLTIVSLTCWNGTTRDGNGAPYPPNPWGFHLLGGGDGRKTSPWGYLPNYFIPHRVQRGWGRYPIPQTQYPSGTRLVTVTLRSMLKYSQTNLRKQKKL